MTQEKRKKEERKSTVGARRRAREVKKAKLSR
jgi:hypothetical protein